ncbi:MAG TPA: hypothetical protein VEE84_00835, partial [Burkholderiaceae bacterium]|nr:hypothetical protein [Burkholderiaceae bacterium]
SELLAAAGLTHPSQLRPHHIVHRVSPTEIQLLSATLPTLRPGELLGAGPLQCRHPAFERWWDRAVPDSFALQAPATSPKAVVVSALATARDNPIDCASEACAPPPLHSSALLGGDA